MAKVIEMLGGDTVEIEKQLMTGSPHDKQPDICQALTKDKPRVLAAQDTD